MLKLVKIS